MDDPLELYFAEMLVDEIISSDEADLRIYGCNGKEELLSYLLNRNNHIEVETFTKYLLEAIRHSSPEYEIPRLLVREFPLKSFNAKVEQTEHGILILVDIRIIEYSGLLSSVLVRTGSIYNKIIPQNNWGSLSEEKSVEYVGFLFACMLSKTPFSELDKSFKELYLEMGGIHNEIMKSINSNPNLYQVFTILHFEIISFILAHELAHMVNGDLEKELRYPTFESILDKYPEFMELLDSGKLGYEPPEEMQQELRADELALFLLFNGSRRVNEFSPRMRDNNLGQFILFHSLAAFGIFCKFNQIFDSTLSYIKTGDMKPRPSFYIHYSHPPGGMRYNNGLEYLKKQRLVDEQGICAIQETFNDFFNRNENRIVKNIANYFEAIC